MHILKEVGKLASWQVSKHKTGKLNNSKKPVIVNIYLTSLFLAVILFSSELPAVTFGKNNIQYTYFHWKYLTTEHFDIYYNQGGKKIADFAAEIAEKAYQDIAKTYLYSTANDDPITIITYQSHNDFEQTNVTGQPDESTGGLTEFLRTRIVVPFEGNHEKFRHVIHHELTHAMMLNMLYGQGFGAIVAGLSQSRIPLWFIEGLAEYMSNDGLDPETEMFLRDAVVNDILPEIPYLGSYGYLGVYKCGQSILYFIAWRYGDEKVGEILHQLMSYNNFDQALKAAIGIDVKELSKRWRRFIKERYWPLMADMEPPDQFSQQLTDHIKDYCYVNNSPALSPNGEWLAFLSNRSDYFDVYLLNALDGKVHRQLLHGQRSGKFEELHWLRPGITWSPDGKQIALCAKAGEHDVLYTINVDNAKIAKTFKYKSDGMFSPSWSPDGKNIAMVLIHEGQSDIVTLEVETGQLYYVTHDIFDVADPSWSYDSKRLLFTSNRGDYKINESLPTGQDMSDYDFENFDIYEINIETHILKRITNDPFVERTPLWTPLNNTILYVSDMSGIYNLYIHNIEDDQRNSITNTVSGIFQPTIARNVGTLAFSSFFNNGYDIFLMNDPFTEDMFAEALQIPLSEKIPSRDDNGSSLGLSSRNYNNFVFDRIFHLGEKESKAAAEGKDSVNVVVRERQSDGKYPNYDYRMQLKPDLVFVNAAYSPYYLMQGAGMVVLNDELGNHQLNISADLNRSTKYSNFFVGYNYLARRIDIGGGVYHYAYPFYSGNLIWLDRNYGAFLMASYPINRFNRVDFGIDLSSVDRSELSDLGESGSLITTILPHIGYVHDTSIWRWATSPGNGGRWRIDLHWSPDLFNDYENRIDFRTISFDWRRYFTYHKDYTFAVRTSGAFSEGKTPQRFFMGGMMNWFNSRFDNPTGGVIIDMKDIYFSRFVTPLRGVGYYNQVGTRYLLGNFEFRYPFIRYLVFGWPLPAYFRDVRGALFTDLGVAWYPDNINGQALPNLDDWSNGFGFGIRFDLGIFPIEWDIAWSKETDMLPQYYFSLNFGF
ncbi:MAG: hypothetical protein P9X24_13950 [Candidatus Hatepunaea meridiana]|nr:hypothetical protein [Candidatus Hatepunaea meridiana]